MVLTVKTDCECNENFFYISENVFIDLYILVIFFGGVQLLTVGVLGQYIGILFDEIKARPEYIIDEKKNF